MRLPKLKRLNTSREMLEAFKGYNHNLRIGDGEFYDMTNLTSDDYPVLSPRRPRGIYALPENPLGMISKDSLCYVDGSKFIINEYEIDMGLNDKPKALISMGAYVIIMPDKKYINTKALNDYGPIEAEVETTAEVVISLCKSDGSDYDVPTENIGPTAPPLPPKKDGAGNAIEGEYEEVHDDGTLWLDTSEEAHVLKRYSVTYGQWAAVSSTYVKISSAGIGEPFAEGDGVIISGIKDADLQDLNTTMVIHARGDDYIVVTGIIAKVVTQPYYDDENKAQPIAQPVTVKRQMPAMDFIIESGNRLWGCRYGVANNGQVVNEIYASKLGDFKNWNCFAGISTDSYVASVGTDGQFTGAIAHLGYPLFFKENHIHKVYGNYPANYQIQATACRGVQKGSHKSLAIVNETVFYKASSSVCAYDGSLPFEISSALGDVAYSDAVAGVLGNKYYISMKEANTDGEKDKYHLFVYDTKKGMWHREDDTQVSEFCNSRGELYFIDYGDVNKAIHTVRGTGDAHEEMVEWSAETGIIGLNHPDKKYISRIDVRMSANIGTKVTIYAEYDSSGVWEHVLAMDVTSLRTFSVPVRPERCDHMRMRIDGKGDVKIFSICKTYSIGSDI